jgi:diphosphomevalonate decarboxylase
MGYNNTIALNGVDKDPLKGDKWYDSEGAGSVTWRSPSNIALVKYWGKRSGQIPENPSVSITLEKSFTETTVKYFPVKKNSGTLRKFTFEGKEKKPFRGRLVSYLKEITGLYPFLKNYDLFIESSNSFPHSAGIASSASAMSALALCLTSMEKVILDSQNDADNFFRKASYAARIGSGSAARSVFPGFVLWGYVPEILNSANEWAVPLEDVNEIFRDMGNAILLVDDTPKDVSSSTGHVLMQANPWAPVRYGQAVENTIGLMEAISSGDMDEFTRIVESEAMTLHALMMSSGRGYFLLKPGTIEIIERVRKFRRETDIPLAFTLDAGPNVHIIYPRAYHERISSFIESQLIRFCKTGKWIDDTCGRGPVEIGIKHNH